MATKAELIDAVAATAGATKADTERVLDAFFDYVTASIKQGEQVAWPGFGKFSTDPAGRPHGPQPADGRDGHDRRLDGDEVHPQLHPQGGAQPESKK